MNSNRDLERRIADFYAQEGLVRAPDRVLAGTLTTVEQTRQRRVFGRLFGSVSWRYPDMNKYLGAAAAAALLLVAVVIGFGLYAGRSSTPGATSSPSASPTSSPTPTISPSAVPTPSGLALTETYTSAVHGVAISYPSGWHLQPATQPWTEGYPTQESAFADIIYQKQINLPFIAVASQPLGDQTAESWTTTFLASFTGGDACGPTQPYTIDGAVGVIAQCGELGPQAVVSAGGRAHVFWLYRMDDLAWFKQILDTVQLNPEAALAGPSAVPSPSSSALALTETYTSAVHGISVGYPATWHLQPATVEWTPGDDLNQDSPFADVIYQWQVDSPFIALSSQSLSGQTAEAWSAAYLATRADGNACGATQPYAIDGVQGVVTQCGDLGPARGRLGRQSCLRRLAVSEQRHGLHKQFSTR